MNASFKLVNRSQDGESAPIRPAAPTVRTFLIWRHTPSITATRSIFTNSQRCGCWYKNDNGQELQEGSKRAMLTTPICRVGKHRMSLATGDGPVQHTGGVVLTVLEFKVPPAKEFILSETSCTKRGFHGRLGPT